MLHSLTKHSGAEENAHNSGVAEGLRTEGLRPARVSSGEDALGPEVHMLERAEKGRGSSTWWHLVDVQQPPAGKADLRPCKLKRYPTNPHLAARLPEQGHTHTDIVQE